MFIGRYYHTLEQKGRLAIPKEFRSKLSSGGVVTMGLDGCLFLFPKSSWQKLSDKLASLPLTSKPARIFTRLLVQQAASVDLDPQGRTLLPLHLREIASLSKKIVVAGALTRVEIWDQNRYHQHLKKLELEMSEIENQLTDLDI